MQVNTTQNKQTTAAYITIDKLATSAFLVTLTISAKHIQIMFHGKIVRSSAINEFQVLNYYFRLRESR